MVSKNLSVCLLPNLTPIFSGLADQKILFYKPQDFIIAFAQKNLPWVNFINAKCWHLKCQIMEFKHQNWRLTFMKYHKTLLAFKTLKYCICIA